MSCSVTIDRRHVDIPTGVGEVEQYAKTKQGRAVTTTRERDTQAGRPLFLVEVGVGHAFS
jgi:hypothetical protein